MASFAARAATRAYSSSAATASFARSIGAPWVGVASPVPKAQQMFAGKGGYATFEMRKGDGMVLKGMYAVFAIGAVLAVDGMFGGWGGEGVAVARGREGEERRGSEAGEWVCTSQCTARTAMVRLGLGMGSKSGHASDDLPRGRRLLPPRLRHIGHRVWRHCWPRRREKRETGKGDQVVSEWRACTAIPLAARWTP